MSTEYHTQFARSAESQKFWGRVGAITVAMAEVLCYNELTVFDPERPGETRQIVPNCLLVQGGRVKFIGFEGGDRKRIEHFRKAGLFYVLRNPTWHHNQLTSYTVRRQGDDPRDWVKQTIQAYTNISHDLRVHNTPSLDPMQLEAEVVVQAQELMHEAITLRLEHIVHIHDKTFPVMLHRIHSLYNIPIDGYYQQADVPCTPKRPCLMLKCSQCSTDEKRIHVRRHAAMGFISPPYTAPCCPEFVKEIWCRPDVSES